MKHKPSTERIGRYKIAVCGKTVQHNADLVTTDLRVTCPACIGYLITKTETKLSELKDIARVLEIQDKRADLEVPDGEV